MKKLIFASLMLAAMFTACAGKTNDKKTEETKESAKAIHLTTAEFKKKVANYESTNPTEWKYLGDKPCIVDFYTTWCGPCKMVAPILEDLANEYNGKIYIYKVDIEAEPELATAFGIQSIPATLFCPLKGAPQMTQGAMPKESFVKNIGEILLVPTTKK